MAKFPERLKQLRKENGWTQADLAKKTKMSRSSISMFEYGQRDPNTETLELLSDIFNVDMDYLIGRTHLKHAINNEFILENNMDLETLVYLNKLSKPQLDQLIAVAKAMFPEVK